MITLSRFYKWLGLPEFFNILKFLGQKEKIILQCVCALDDLHLISHEVHALSLPLPHHPHLYILFCAKTRHVLGPP